MSESEQDNRSRKARFQRYGRPLVIRHPELMDAVTPVPGTDVRAVQGPEDADPVLLGELVVQ